MMFGLPNIRCLLQLPQRMSNDASAMVQRAYRNSIHVET